MDASKAIVAQDLGGAKNDVGKRSDSATSSGPCGESGMFAWCEVEMIQDAVCGNGLNFMDSRDDDAQNETSMASPEVGGDRLLEDELKAFGEELDQPRSLSFKLSSSGIQENNNLAVVSTSNVDKDLILSRINSSQTSVSVVDKLVLCLLINIG